MDEMRLKLARKNREIDPPSWDELYNAEIVRRIRSRYSVDRELAVLRQRDTKPDEFEAYNAFAEECKAAVKAEMYPDGHDAETTATKAKASTEDLFFFD